MTLNGNAFKAVLGAAALALAVPAAPAGAATVSWTTWSSNTAGTISGGPSVTYSGELSGLSSNYPSWTPASTWADGSIVNNAPPQSGNMIRLLGGGGASAVLDTLTFSTPVTNPVMAIWSLGAPGAQAQFVFNNATPTLIKGGPSAEFAGTSISVSGNTVSGSEGNGTVEFLGTFTSISWRNPLAENYYGFTVGIGGGGSVSAVPEPGTWALVAGGLGLLGFAVKRNRSA